ncbi:pyruvate formate lyase-activating protein [Bacillus sp. HMF5848]|uniref:pyruvate formate-lyase-activating protein n=1 Tax=Bacillus sp. HMF5848 TaxID=2495421 RepID=UPI000F796DA9|nr:pyruvate formate-lyase-activating protein [Bacillus sp. HMF5848]RSK27746.1 pyruvate formate lyase-activating protein [Bacillus sp. HMF5848]
MLGRIHSVETCGTVDGPGIRYIVFTQGCPLRCIYCHNADTWERNGGNEMSIDDILDDVAKYESYIKFSNGGITVSGGEPLLQPEFVYELFKACKERGIHTALDTSGSVHPKILDDILSVTDLVLLDIKHIDADKHKELTGLSNNNTLKFAKLLNEKNIPVWIRHVLVPGYTNNEKDLSALGEFLSTLSNIEKLEVLPYHKMGEYKWEALGFENKLTEVVPPSKAEVERAYEILTTR